ncbi:hypothetical protein [Halomonas sp. MCCC 1A11062]|uniref:hypothetical protein n=1 Tax=Halomonas sp. MCCC 1A11062 TaxID=2733485 RepID=UPI001F3BE662|nr:hypothetical protein [Halomonas sp. MCCC 1A11062]MCE8039276.1 hypothetical protein [Halomonas sp. MCCC 1A11062]
MNYQSQMLIKQHKEDVSQFTASFNPSFFITLIFRADLSRQKAEESLAGFIRKMNRCFFPRKSRYKLRVLPVLEMGLARYLYQSCDIEKVEANWHIHLIMENPIERESNVSHLDVIALKKLVGNLWGATPYGDRAFTTRYDRADWFQPIYDMDNLTGYIFKEVPRNEMAVMYEYANNSGVK